MTQYAFLRYYYRSKTAQAIILHISIILHIYIHKLTWTTSRFKSSVMANVLKVRLENKP